MLDLGQEMLFSLTLEAVTERAAPSEPRPRAVVPEAVLQEPPKTPLQPGVLQEPRGKSCTQLAAPRPAPKERF